MIDYITTVGYFIIATWFTILAGIMILGLVAGFVNEKWTGFLRSKIEKYR